MQKGENRLFAGLNNWKHMPVSLWLWILFLASFFMKNTHTAEQYVLEWLLSLLVCVFQVGLMVVFQVLLSCYCQSKCNSAFLRQEPDLDGELCIYRSATFPRKEPGMGSLEPTCRHTWQAALKALSGI